MRKKQVQTDSSQDEDVNDSYEKDLTSESEEEDSMLSDHENDDDSSDCEDNTAYQEWLGEAKEDTEDMWTETLDKYVRDELGVDESKDKANMKTLWVFKRIFFNNYTFFCQVIKYHDTHQEIVAVVKQKLDKGLSIHKAIKRVMPKHQAKFDRLFLQESDEDNMEDSDD